MAYEYTKKDKVSIIKMDNQIVPIMISNKKNILIEYMSNIRGLKDDEYGIYSVQDMLIEHPNIFNNINGAQRYSIEEYIIQSEFKSLIIPSIDIWIIMESYQEAISTLEEMIKDINKTLVALNVTKKSINNDLLKSLLESRKQLEKALHNKKQMKDIITGYQYSNSILTCNIYDYIEVRKSVINTLEMTKEYKDICDLPF